MEETVVVLITASSMVEGERIGRKLVEERLAACANVVPNLRSFFWWQGKLTEEGEVLLLIKTRRSLLEPLVARVKRLHSYEVPEIIALPVVAGSEDYLRWVAQETARPSGVGHEN